MERAYKIKNLIKELPTYDILFKRQVEGINSDICIRCTEQVENWEHVWICEYNDMSVREVIESAVWKSEEYLLRKVNMGKLQS
jgi:hypothetical protein